MTKKVLGLTNKQIATIPQELQKGQHLRFFCDSCPMHPISGEVSKRGMNVLYQTVYWDRPRKFGDDIVAKLRKNNPKHRFTYIIGNDQQEEI